MLLDTKDNAQRKIMLKEAMKNIEESLKILNLEPKNSIELRWKPAAEHLKKALIVELNKL